MKLKNLKPAVKRLRPSVAYMPRGEKERRADRASLPWTKWYNSARWRQIRLIVFRRDKYICQRTGQLCSGRGNDPLSPVANHKIPHRGDPKLFWDINNIETVTKEHHDSVIQREEKSGSSRA